ncbi:50S ribosomal protein L3 [Mycoplasmopsis californica]|uniref:Large ribosomal subunit protein uL3 n=1 Tax=Mycoplasmopsis equigenitalium TaxID=114883 RepID=A0ABY5J1F4_9BACT|nr:50S ribosomal protein L3 [Mycoplasmopsis equigenitalium]UUD37085.1 50S ribosomal protein L3 [Mycoplasmopsis equigenitalium]VEU69614.1 50S ribosomal protein L3 [Mycoplasmopsis californica]
MKGILGRKVGMTQIFAADGKSLPVTVIEVQPNVVTAVLSQEKNGYVATQLAAFEQKEARVSKPVLGKLKKVNTTPKRYIKEIRNMQGYELGQEINASIFKEGDLIDVTGTSKGKGFAGTIKRWNQAIGPKSHGGGGGSQPVRQTGSLGDISGNKVVKGMTMPGHLGHEKTTVQNLEIVKVDLKNNVIVVRGSIPGPKKSLVVLKEAIKPTNKSKDVIQLVDVKTTQLRNDLLEEAKHLKVEVTVEMSNEDIQQAIETAKANAEQEKAAEAAAEKEGDK